ncbi:MAG: hypothetical protein JXA68_01330 [Ignavibacteriales bacterium]|nr:hypothetical protein [Ignavibacteriales bacterium]
MQKNTPMKQIDKIIFILFLFISCKENKEDEFEIYYNTINDSINTVQYTYTALVTCEYPYPNDSSASIYVDIDGDTINDFYFQKFHYLANFGGRCAVTIHTGYLKAINSEFSIAKLNNDCLKAFERDEFINDTNKWESEGVIYSNFIGCNCYSNFFIGFKKEKNEIINYGWLKVKSSDSKLVIYDYAYNNISNNGIYAGQIK